MKVLLVYPEFPDTFWSFKHALKFVGKRSASPPLGLITVASMLPADWELRLVDLNLVRELKDKELAWADMVFISAMVVQRSSVNEVIELCRAAGKRIVAGGPLFNSEPESFPEVDHLVLNEAEITLPPFLRDLDAGCPKRAYTSEDFPDIRETPSPRWDLLDMKRYASMSIQYSRGCPFDCEFCNVTALFGRRPRTKNVGQLISELDSLYSLGWRGGVFVVDDNFIGNKMRVKRELLPALIAWRRGKKGIAFNTEASVDLADDPELMALMLEAGFDTVFIGIETPDEKGLQECSKKQNLRRDLIADVKKIHEAGLQVQGGFIVGFDSDTPTIFRRQIDFIQRSGIAMAMVGLLQAPPGTRLFARLKRENRIIGDMSGDNADGTTNIVPRMAIKTLREGYEDILRHIYTPKNYYKRLKSFLKVYRAPKVEVPLTWGRVMAFLRSTVHLGIVGRERFQFWKLLFWTRFRRPELFPLSITLMICGHHFRKVCARNVFPRL